MQAHTLTTPEPDETLLASLTLGPTPYAVRLVNRRHPDFRRTECYVQEQFLKAYGARPQLNVPTFLVLVDPAGETLAAVGLRNARGEALFLEQYLDDAVEAEIRSRHSVVVARENIIEIAHLASSKRGMSRFLFVAMTALLSHWQYQWIAFTGTRAIRHIFDSLNMRPVTLDIADPARLPDAGRSWGRYYEQAPMVMAGEIAGGHQTLVATRTYEILNLQLHEGEAHAVA